MIVQFIQGTTRISLKIEGEEGHEPQVSVVPEGPAPTLALSSLWRDLPRPLTLVAVGLLCAGAGYRFAPGRTEPLVSPAVAQLLPEQPSATPAVGQVGQIPSDFLRKMADRPVVTGSVPPDAAVKPSESNPFGLE